MIFLMIINNLPKKIMLMIFLMTIKNQTRKIKLNKTIVNYNFFKKYFIFF